MTHLEWYYQALEVEPIWSEKDNLFYRVVIPLIHDELYLQYSIQTFPIPYPNTDISAQLELNNSYGINTVILVYYDYKVLMTCVSMEPP